MYTLMDTILVLSLPLLGHSHGVIKLTGEINLKCTVLPIMH